MLEYIRDTPGEVLSQADYVACFWEDAKRLQSDFWKLERRQAFQEDDDSWRAAERGDFIESVHLAEAAFEDMCKAWDEEPFTVARRVRVVEEPPTTYLRWELFKLLQWMKLGEEIVVVSPTAVQQWEQRMALPEVGIIGGEVLYEILYHDNGVPDGGRRITDSAVVTAAQVEIASLFDAGESLQSFVDRNAGYPLGRLSIA